MLDLFNISIKEAYNTYFYSIVSVQNLLSFYYDLRCQTAYVQIHLFDMGSKMKGLVSKIKDIMIVFELLVIF